MQSHSAQMPAICPPCQKVSPVIVQGYIGIGLQMLLVKHDCRTAVLPRSRGRASAFFAKVASCQGLVRDARDSMRTDN